MSLRRAIAWFVASCGLALAAANTADAVSSPSIRPTLPTGASASSWCEGEQARLATQLAASSQACAPALQEFHECRAERRELSGVELMGCGVGLTMTLTTGELSEPWVMKQCGSTPSAGWQCPVPACEAEVEALREELETRRERSVGSC